jgi:hypothetical protein
MLTSPTTIVFESEDGAVRDAIYGCRCQNPLFWSETEERKVSDPTYCKKPRRKFIWLGRTFVSPNQDKRAMPIIGEGN